MIKYNLGCGDMILDGFVNVDLYNPKAQIKSDVKNLPFEDESGDYIYASHIIEHFDFYEAFAVLKEWKRVLKTGGTLVLETPDLLNLCKRFIDADEETRIGLYPQFYAYPWIDGQQHKFLYTPKQLSWTLSKAGFIDIQQIPAVRYTNIADICLGMRAIK